MTNPSILELPDLVGLKTEIENWNLPQGLTLSSTNYGTNHSQFKSKGLNFQEIRQYQPGDDIRQIDWRVTAKYGKPYTKLYEEEKEQQTYVLCDLRSPMHFASHGHFKSVIAGRLACLCAFLSEKKHNAFSYQILSNKIYQESNHTSSDIIPLFLNQLTKEPHIEKNVPFAEIRPFLNQHIHTGAVLFLISDFHDIQVNDWNFLGKLSPLNTIILVHIYDHMETEMPEGVFPCSNNKSDLLFNTSGKEFQKKFHDSWNQHNQIIQQQVKKYNMGYLALRTDSDYINIFKTYLMEYA